MSSRGNLQMAAAQELPGWLALCFDKIPSGCGHTSVRETAPGTGPCLQRSCLFPRVHALPWLLVLLKLLQSPLSPVWMRSWRSQVEQARQEP